MRPTFRVACLLGPMFEDAEVEVPVRQLQAAGYKVDIIGSKGGEDLKGYKGRITVRTTHGIADVRPGDYGLLLIPGGHSPDRLRADQRVVDFVAAFEATGRPIAAVCHGPQLLAAAHLVNGRTLTAWKSVRDDLAQMGAIVKDQPVVIDGNWITSRKPEDLNPFSRAILDVLTEQSNEGYAA